MRELLRAGFARLLLWRESAWPGGADGPALGRGPTELTSAYHANRVLRLLDQLESEIDVLTAKARAENRQDELEIARMTVRVAQLDRQIEQTRLRAQQMDDLKARLR